MFHLPLVAIALGAGFSVHAAPQLFKRGTGKGGIGWPINEGQLAPVPEFFGSGSTLSWWYDWDQDWSNKFSDSAQGGTIGGTFFPQMHTIGQYGDGSALQDGFTIVMGINEPDQNGVLAGDAATDYKAYVDAIRATNPNVKFASPAVASDTTWLDSWFAAICPGATAKDGWSGCSYAPDYVQVHMYQTDPDVFQGLVTDYNTNYARDLIVSEFACYIFGSGVTPTAEEVSSFMTSTTKWLDQTDFIYTYAWFGAVRNAAWLYAVPEVNRLMDATGALTALGQQYVAGGH